MNVSEQHKAGAERRAKGPPRAVANRGKTANVRRKLIEFDPATWQQLDLLARDSMKSLQELADEAFRDLLKKYDRPQSLRAALAQSARRSV